MTHDQTTNQPQNAAIVAGNEDYEKGMRTGWLANHFPGLVPETHNVVDLDYEMPE